MTNSKKINTRSLSKKSIILGILLGIISGFLFGTFLFQKATSGVVFGVAMFIASTLMFDSYEKKKQQ